MQTPSFSDDPELLFEVKIAGQKITVPRDRLFRLAKKGEISPDDIITVCGTKIFADSIGGIVFGDKLADQPAELPPVPLSMSASVALQDSFPPKSDGDFDITASGLYGFFKEELESAPPVPHKHEPFSALFTAKPEQSESEPTDETTALSTDSAKTDNAKEVAAQDESERRINFLPIGLGALCLLGLASVLFYFIKASPPGSDSVPTTSQPTVPSKPTNKPKPPQRPKPLYTDIFEALTEGTVDDVKYFITRGVNLNAKNSAGLTPLLYAIDNNADAAMVQTLVSNGADIHVPDSFGDTALHHVVSGVVLSPARYEIMRNLLFHGAEVNAKNNRGETPLCRVVANSTLPSDNVKFLTYLASHGAEVNIYNRAGDTPLHCLAASPLDTLDAITFFISRNADVNAEDRRGRTVLDVANTEKKKAILRAAGAVERSVPSDDLTTIDRVDIPALSTSLPPEMQYNIGLIYYFGTKDVPQDKAEALRWFRAAADQGHAAGQFRIGTYYYFGWVIPKNEREAIRWLKKAESQGNAEASGLLQYIDRQKEIFETEP